MSDSIHIKSILTGSVQSFAQLPHIFLAPYHTPFSHRNFSYSSTWCSLKIFLELADFFWPRNPDALVLSGLEVQEKILGLAGP